METKELLRRLTELQSVSHDAILCSSHLNRLIKDIVKERDKVDR